MTRPRRPRFLTSRLDRIHPVRSVRALGCHRRTRERASEPSEKPALNRTRRLARRDPDLDGLPAALAGQGEDALAMFAISRIDAASEFAIRVNPQMFALSVLTPFGAGRTAGPHGAAAKFHHLFELVHVESH